jgi:predicted lysophospholipase L1 biosynthesis ABC-type transport system permease subunit
VGIIDDVRFLGLQTDVGSQIILPAGHNPGVLTSLVVRSTRRDPQLAATIRETLHALHPTVAVHDSRDMTTRLEATLDPQRRAMAGAAAAAALFGILGVTGLVSNLLNYVTRTRRAIGIRVAFGATRQHVVRLVLSRAARLVVCGSALGCGLGALGLRYLVHHQPGLIVPGLPGYVIASGVVTLVGLAAAWPATRAALRIEPSSLLREDSYR